jgi:hypothetical protein
LSSQPPARLPESSASATISIESLPSTSTGRNATTHGAKTRIDSSYANVVTGSSGSNDKDSSTQKEAREGALNTQDETDGKDQGCVIS